MRDLRIGYVIRPRGMPSSPAIAHAPRQRARASGVLALTLAIAFQLIALRASAGDVPSKSKPKAAPEWGRVFGYWNWIQSRGGHGSGTPAECGCERVLVLSRDGKYEFGQKSAGALQRSRTGSFSVLRGAKGDLELSLDSTWIDSVRTLSIHFGDGSHDTLELYSSCCMEDSILYRFARGVPDSWPLSADSKALPGEGTYVYYEDEPVPLTQVEPDASKADLPQGTTVTVTTHVLVGIDGRVKGVKVIKGAAGLNELAIDALKQWTFKPALSNGKPVAVWVEVPVNFHR